MLNVVLSPSLRSRVELAKQSSEESLSILLELLGLDESENPDLPTNGDRAELEATPQKSSGEALDEYDDARQRLQHLETWWQTWQRSRSDATFSEHLAQLLEELGDILRIPDLLRELENEEIDTLILVPDRQLHCLPLHALLPDRFNTAYLPSLKFVTASLPDRDSRTLPDPWLKSENETQKTSPQEEEIKEKPINDILSAGIESVEHKGNEAILNLPHAVLESAAICHGFATSLHLTNPQTVKAKILDALTKGHRFCHLSTVPTYNRKSPLQSAIVFPGGDPLTLAELRELPLSKLELLSFSGVETFCGSAIAPSSIEDCAGWGAALLAEGVAYVLIPLWYVDSIARVLFTLEFYRCLARNSTPPVALKQAQLWLRSITYSELLRWYGDRIREMGNTSNVHRSVFEEAVARIQNDPAKMELTDPPYAHPYYWGSLKLFGKPYQ
ncbi:MAG: CHAT domain-containing protein [Spirulina sp.]